MPGPLTAGILAAKHELNGDEKALLEELIKHFERRQQIRRVGRCMGGQDEVEAEFYALMDRVNGNLGILCAYIDFLFDPDRILHHGDCTPRSAMSVSP